jgi:hypothetical protein
VTYRERVVHGSVNSDHLLQLFDTSESLADTLAGFLSDGFSQGKALLVVSRPQHWALTAERLKEQGCPVDDAIDTGQLTVLDAAATMRGFMRHGVPDPNLFDQTVGALVRNLTGRGAGLHVYGEMVDLLAAEGNYRAAQQLEEVWNQLGERESYTLFCGYSAVNFGDPRTGDALAKICKAHNRLHVNPVDRLGSWLLASNGNAVDSAGQVS